MYHSASTFQSSKVQVLDTFAQVLVVFVFGKQPAGYKSTAVLEEIVSKKFNKVGNNVDL